ncbi:MAG: CapA family protein [Acidimicrobiia bacterium]|nr:CapA family protein [Acidimicrobiia bacterium]
MSRSLIAFVLLLAGCGSGVATVEVLVPPTAPTTTTVVADVRPSTTIGAPPLATVTLAFGGDTSFTHGLANADPFAGVAGLITEADLFWINLETAVAEEGVGTTLDKEYVFISPPVTAELLAAAGVDGVALANNHAMDAGINGLARTLDLLDAAGVAHAGAGLNRAEAYAPALARVGSESVAVVSFSRVLPSDSWTATENRPGLASAYQPFVDESVATVSRAAQLADLVVVMVHWGIERSECPEAYQRELAVQWAGAGADLIIGSHPHVLQGVERIAETWVVYSTGNLAFPSAYSEDTTQTALFWFTTTDDGTELHATPVRIVEGRPKIASDADRATILGTLNGRSINVVFDSAGRATVAGGDSVCR